MNEEIINLCEEILHLDYILEELHHYSGYDLEKVRLEYCLKLLELERELKKLTSEDWFNNQMASDMLIVKEKMI